MRKSGWRVFVGALMVLVAQTAAAAGRFTVDQVMADLNLPADAAARLRHGEILHSDPQESSDRELGVDLTFLVQQPLAEVLKAFRTLVDLKANPQLSASVQIRGPGNAADFASLVLEPGGAAEANRYLAASPGDTLNLSADEIQAFNALASAGDDPKPQVEEQLKRLLLARYQAYLARGLGGMAPYERRSEPCETSGNCGAPPKRRGSSSNTRRRCSSCCSRIHRESLRGSKSTSTGCATTSTAARTTHYAIGWQCRWERSSLWRTASST